MRGDIHAIKGPKDARGREQRGKRFAVVIQSDDLMGLSTVIIALTSTSASPSLTRPEVNWDGTPTRVMVEQMTAVDWSRLDDSIGHLSPDEMHAVDDAIRDVLFV